MQPMSIEEQALREQMDYWAVWVDRGVRVFLGWEGTSEDEAWEQFEHWKRQINVELVKVFVNGNLAELYERKS